MDAPFEGFWQVLVDDPDEWITAAGTTTVAVRESACWIYAGGHYMEFWAEKSRAPVTLSRPTDEEAAAIFRAHRAVGGRFDWELVGDEVRIEHHPTMSVDPRMAQRPYRHVVRMAGDAATAEAVDGDAGRGGVHRWRRLSASGTSPLAGAWESDDGTERYLYLVTQGHYGVMRTASRGSPRDQSSQPTTDAEAVSLFHSRSLNAGAHLLSSRTFDHWPMFSSTPGYTVTKHPTFYLKSIQDDRFLMTFDPDEQEAAIWTRVG